MGEHVWTGGGCYSWRPGRGAGVVRTVSRGSCDKDRSVVREPAKLERRTHSLPRIRLVSEHLPTTPSHTQHCDRSPDCRSRLRFEKKIWSPARSDAAVRRRGTGVRPRLPAVVMSGKRRKSAERAHAHRLLLISCRPVASALPALNAKQGHHRQIAYALPAWAVPSKRNGREERSSPISCERRVFCGQWQAALIHH